MATDVESVMAAGWDLSSAKKTNPQYRRAFAVAAIISVAIIMFIGIYFSPQLLGIWESYDFYGIFGARVLRISLAIPLGGMGALGYPVLEVVRPLGDWINWSLVTTHLPNVLFGWLALLLFWHIARRWFSAWPALAATMLLACNPIFVTYQHQLLSMIPSCLGLLLVIERLQTITRSWHSRMGWAGLGAALAFVLLNYCTSRVQAAMLILIAIGLAFLLATKSGTRLFFTGNTAPPPGAQTVAARVRMVLAGGLLRNICLMLLTMTAVLAVLDLDNLGLLLKPSILFLLGASETTLDIGLLPETIGVNLNVLAETLFLVGNTYHSNSPIDTLVVMRYPLMTWASLPFFIIGILVALRRTFTRGAGYDMPWLTLHILFVITAGPILASLVVTNEAGEPMPTLSTPRLFNVLIPIYFYVAVGVRALAGTAGQWPVARVTLAAAIMIAVGAQCWRLTMDHWRFSDQVAGLVQAPSWDTTRSTAVFTTGKRPTDQGLEPFAYFTKHVYYRRIAAAAASQIAASDADGQNHDRMVYIVNIDLPADLVSMDIPGYVAGYNHHVVFLALYAADLGINAGFIQFPEERSVAGYRSMTEREREYSQKTVVTDGHLGYLKTTVAPVLRRTGPNFPRAIIVTTPEERTAALAMMNERGVQTRSITLP